MLASALAAQASSTERLNQAKKMVMSALGQPRRLPTDRCHFNDAAVRIYRDSPNFRPTLISPISSGDDWLAVNQYTVIENKAIAGIW
jgi:hypothetical protein